MCFECSAERDASRHRNKESACKYLPAYIRLSFLLSLFHCFVLPDFLYLFSVFAQRFLESECTAQGEYGTVEVAHQLVLNFKRKGKTGSQPVLGACAQVCSELGF